MPNSPKQPRRRRCACCNQLKPAETVKTRINPYEQDVHDRTIKQPLCDDCVEQLAQDI